MLGFPKDLEDLLFRKEKMINGVKEG